MCFAYIFDSVYIIWSGSLVFAFTITRDLARKIRLVCCLRTFLSQLHCISWKWVDLFGVEEDVSSLVNCIWQDGIRNCAHGKQMSSLWSIVMEDVYRISSFCLKIWLCLHHLKQKHLVLVYSVMSGRDCNHVQLPGELSTFQCLVCGWLFCSHYGTHHHHFTNNVFMWFWVCRV